MQDEAAAGTELICLCLSWQITRFLYADIIISVLRIINSKQRWARHHQNIIIVLFSRILCPSDFLLVYLCVCVCVCVLEKSKLQTLMVAKDNNEGKA